MIDIAVTIALIGLSVALALVGYRVLRGPTVADRVVALDAASVALMALLVVGSIRLRETKYFGWALALAVLSFVATVAFAKYIERGIIFERDPD